MSGNSKIKLSFFFQKWLKGITPRLHEILNLDPESTHQLRFDNFYTNSMTPYIGP